MSPEFSPLAGRIEHDGPDPWALHWRARAAHAAGEDVIVLSVGDPDLDTPAPVVDKAIERLRARDTHYTESSGRAPLRAAIAAAHTERTGQRVTADQVIFVNGAQNGLFVSSLLVAAPGDEVITLDPMYATYPATIQVSGAALVRVPAPARRDFHPDLATLAAAITPRTRAIFVATPGNPSGVVLTDSEVEGIARLAEQHGLWVVSDEVYAGTAEGGRVPSLGARLPEQCLTVSSLSKTHAMTGWRCGWIVGPTAFIQHADLVAQCMTYGLPGFIQDAALTALGMRTEAEASVRTLCRARRDTFYAALQGLSAVRVHRPDAGMFMLLDVRETGLSGTEFANRLYESERVSVLDGAACGSETEGFVRVCFVTNETTLAEAARRIRRFAAGLGRSG
ncbi:MAG TPA: pyridoxal phosphate-dependent aminotransferase [Steroidobacteraceae bacterium]|nr:pyridoxal phosphate-dependent aminotransferase [Steroidobacteraceae bacterium]